MRLSKLLREEVRHDDPLRSAIDEIAGRLHGTDAFLTSSIAEILAAAQQELIEALALTTAVLPSGQPACAAGCPSQHRA